MKFYLGFHHPHQLAFAGVPLFVSHRQLVHARLRTLPRSIAPWALDSGGFTEVSTHGRWVTSAAEYHRAIIRYRDEIGHMDWAAPQDWMCEPWILQKTGLSIAEHQQRTVASVLELRALGAPVIPVLQGWTLEDYLECLAAYDDAGIDLRTEPVVGLGSVCRRQETDEAAHIVMSIASRGIRLHGFGFKITGLLKVHRHLVSADSMSWSYTARLLKPLPECVGKHKACSNCLRYALLWREKLIRSLLREDQKQQAIWKPSLCVR